MGKLVFLINLKPSSHRTAEESLGVQYLASVLESLDFEVSILDNWLDSSMTNKDVYEVIMKQKDDICFVGTSSYMLSNSPTIELITKLKEDGINVVAGGYGPTFESEIFLRAGVDFVCIGEGEKTIIDVANYFSGKLISKNDIRGVGYLEDGELNYTFKQHQVQNLDEVKFPTRPLIKLLKKRKSTVNILTSRGCMGKCSFCSVSAFGEKQVGKKWRGRSISDIVKELKFLQAQGVGIVKLIDDSFIENERDNQWCKTFADALEREGITMYFRASIRSDKVNMENMEHLKRAGFFSFSCGIENGSESALKRMGKMASLNDNLNAIKCFREHDYYVQAGFILFDNKTTLNELKENYSFLSDNIDLVTKGIFSEMFAAKGTEFTYGLDNENGNQFSSNKLYEVEDGDARKVYRYLKKWQSNHIGIYDKVIDPISAPKAIKLHRMKKYHELMVQMKGIDLMFMQDLIKQVESSGDLDALYYSYLQKYTPFFEKCQATVNHFYCVDELQYDADTNKFILFNNVQSTEEEG